VSTAESLEAFAALELIGYGERATLKDALRLVIAKSAEERERFDVCFDRYFAGAGGGPAAFDPAADAAAGAEDAASEAVRAAVADSALAQLLLADDRGSLVRNLHAAAAETDVSTIRLFTQANMYARRILERLGIGALDEAIARLRASGDPAQARVADFLAGRRRAVAELARDLVEKRLAVGVDERSRVRDDFLRDARLANVDRRDLERMRVLVREMARRIATRHSRVRKRDRRGHLDVRHTMRRNIAFDGVPFRTAWKKRKIEKPRVVLICDVSGSVAPLAHFLLLFVHSLTEALSDVHSFAFSNTMLDVTDILEQHEIDEAITRIMREIGFRSSDYGRALGEFERDSLHLVDHKTTVVILGDGRTNYANPRVDVLRKLFERAKRVVWLNPENRVGWGIDDSEMLRYLPYCHVATVCNRLRDLERAVVQLLDPV
jgi:uncharacterized protein with von Willebrand factor type A (vWA) domain